MSEKQAMAKSAIEAAEKAHKAYNQAAIASEAAKDIEVSTARLIMKSVKSEVSLALEYAVQAAEFAVKSAHITGDQKAIDDANATLSAIQSASDSYKLIF